MARVSFVNPRQYKSIRMKEFIESRRRTLGKSQKEVGEAIGLSQQSYSRIVKSKDIKTEFSATELVLLFKELEMSKEEICEQMQM